LAIGIGIWSFSGHYDEE